MMSNKQQICRLMSGRIKRTLLESPAYNISPWEEEHRIPDYYLHSVITPSKKTRNIPIVFRSGKKEDISTENPIERRGNVLRSQPAFSNSKNIGCLECIQYSWTDPKIPENSLAQKPKQKNVIIARKRTRNGLEIKSIKKKLLDTSQLVDKHFPFFEERTPLKHRFRLITESKLNHTTDTHNESQGFPKGRQKRMPKSHHISISREFLTQISTIATISKQKIHKCRTQEPSLQAQDWKMQRSLFLETNSKFKTWQRKTQKTLAYSITLPIPLV